MYNAKNDIKSMKEVVCGRHEGVALNNSETMLTKTFKVDGLVRWDLIFLA